MKKLLIAGLTLASLTVLAPVNNAQANPYHHWRSHHASVWRAQHCGMYGCHVRHHRGPMHHLVRGW